MVFHLRHWDAYQSNVSSSLPCELTAKKKMPLNQFKYWPLRGLSSLHKCCIFNEALKMWAVSKFPLKHNDWERFGEDGWLGWNNSSEKRDFTSSVKVKLNWAMHEISSVWTTLCTQDDAARPLRDSYQHSSACWESQLQTEDSDWVFVFEFSPLLVQWWLIVGLAQGMLASCNLHGVICRINNTVKSLLKTN